MIPIRFDNNDITGYQRWNYKWWYALAEFVDNSTHNYFANREALDRQFTLDDARFEIKITVDRDGDNEIIESCLTFVLPSSFDLGDDCE